MTEEELDLLASAYLDGEATSEEVATVERDPQLLARVEELRGVGRRLGATVDPPASLKQRHLSAALAAFDANPDVDGAAAAEGLVAATTIDGPTADGATADGATADGATADGATADGATADGATADGATADGAIADGATADGAISAGRVVDLRERARRPERARRRSIPQWLPAAAAFLLLGGGVIWLAGRSGGDGFEAADAGSEETAELEAAADGGGDGDATASMAAAPTEDQAADEAADDAAATTTLADLEMNQDEADSAEAAAADSETAGAERQTGPAAGGFFPEEPVLQFSGLPDRDDLLKDLPPPRPDLLQSRCGDVLEAPADWETLGYLPIEVDGGPAEVFVAVDGDGEQVFTVVDENCAILLP